MEPGSFSHVLLLLGQRKSFVIPRSSFTEVRYIEVSLYTQFVGWEGYIVKYRDRGLENADRGRRPKIPFTRVRTTV